MQLGNYLKPKPNVKDRKGSRYRQLQESDICGCQDEACCAAPPPTTSEEIEAEIAKPGQPQIAKTSNAATADDDMDRSTHSA